MNLYLSNAFSYVILIMVKRMYIKLAKNEVFVEEASTFWKRLKGFMFRLEPIESGLLFPHCRSVHTYFMFQSIDVIMLDKNYRILYLFPSLGSERIIGPKKGVYYTLELPVGSCQDLKVGDRLEIEKQED